MYFLFKAERKAFEERLEHGQAKLDEAVQAARAAGDFEREAKELDRQVQRLQVGLNTSFSYRPFYFPDKRLGLTQKLEIKRSHLLDLWQRVCTGTRILPSFWSIIYLP